MQNRCCVPTKNLGPNKPRRKEIKTELFDVPTNGDDHPYKQWGMTPERDKACPFTRARTLYIISADDYNLNNA